MEKKVIIIGTGPTGLSTALAMLEKDNFQIELFDSEKSVGGLATSQEVDGMNYDWGLIFFIQV